MQTFYVLRFFLPFTSGHDVSQNAYLVILIFAIWLENAVWRYT
jgi:hypothetical protein